MDFTLLLLAQADTARSASLRMIAAITLLAVICGLLYVLRGIRNFKAEGRAATERPARNTMIFIACAALFAIVCLLLFLVAKA